MRLRRRWLAQRFRKAMRLARQLAIFHFSGLHQVIWRFTSLWELLNIVKYVSISFMSGTMGLMIISGFVAYPRSVLLIYYLLNVITVCITRISVRIYYSHFKNSLIFSSEIKGIIRYPEFERSVNFNALASYLSFRYPTGQNNNFFKLSCERAIR